PRPGEGGPAPALPARLDRGQRGSRQLPLLRLLRAGGPAPGILREPHARRARRALPARRGPPPRGRGPALPRARPVPRRALPARPRLRAASDRRRVVRDDRAALIEASWADRASCRV